VNSESHDAPLYVIFSSPLLLHLISTNHPQHLILKRPRLRSPFNAGNQVSNPPEATGKLNGCHPEVFEGHK